MILLHRAMFQYYTNYYDCNVNSIIGLMDTQRISSVIPVFKEEGKFFPLGGNHLLAAIKSLSSANVDLPEGLK